jgi:hypothetical protein
MVDERDNHATLYQQVKRGKWRYVCGVKAA